MPSTPSAPSSWVSSRAGTVPDSYQSAMCGLSFSSTCLRTVSRIARSSSPMRPSVSNRASGDCELDAMGSASQGRTWTGLPAQQSLGHMGDLHLVGARVDHQALGVTGELLDAVLGHVAVAAEQLHGLHRDLGGGP